MVQNPGRKVTLVCLLLVISALLLWFNTFRLGLDLQGGTRLSYDFDFEQARKEGTIAEGENELEILSQTIDILYNRIDPNGVLEPIIRAEGTHRVVIELPGRAGLQGVSASAPLAEAIDASARTLTLAPDNDSTEKFPENGGVIRVGTEQMRYESRRNNVLSIPSSHGRAHLATTAAAHAAGATVTLVSDDAIRNAIENLGQLQFLIVANAADFTGSGTDLSSETDRLQTWAGEHPGSSITNFNRVAEADGGPNALIRWFPRAAEKGEEDLAELNRAKAVLVPTDEWTFRGGDLGKVYGTMDSLGYPAVGFEMQPARKSAFGDFTGENINRNMAIVLNGQIETFPNLESRLPGSGIIRGRFSSQEVRDLVTVLRTGSLKMKPILEAEEVVGPTLGADHVNRGLMSGALGLSVVLAFIIFYYRRLGVYASISLIATLVFLMGGLAMFQATLTLPGIAGIILTVGMAVDANILIYDRIREEMDKGRNIKQAAKNGFDRALTTIVDANVTTLITALVLKVFGTGPVRGFANTLSIGIIASMFSALVISRLLVHFALEKNVTRFSMGTWLVEAKYKFIHNSRIAIAASTLLIVAGVSLFASIDNNDKLGIDFLGGGTVMFRTETPQTAEDMRALIGGIEGEIGDSAEVKPVLSTGLGDGYTAFRTTFKIDPKALDSGGGDVIDTFRGAVRAAVGDLLQKGPVEVSLGAGTAGDTTVDLRIHLDEAHSPQDVGSRLAAAGFTGVDIEVDSSRPNTFKGSAETDTGGDALAIQTAIIDAFSNQTDTQGVAFNLSNPIPESNLVGAQVVGELKDKAILALLISLFFIIMYIRVRFAEYSYGFAAVAALVHDVLITLGAIAVAIQTGLVEVEINLPLIAAFLTIIGYSLNDTIVLFDRVRENLPRVQKPLGEVLDLSINQTLSRTILTSITTFLAVAMLFAFNVRTGNVLEGFAFAMMIGVLAGTYSSVFVASPVLLWLEGRKEHKRPGTDGHKARG